MKQQERFFRRRMRRSYLPYAPWAWTPILSWLGISAQVTTPISRSTKMHGSKFDFWTGMMYFNFYRSIFARKNWMRLLSQRAIQIKAQCNCGSASPPIYPAQSGLDRHSASSSCTVRTNSSISREHHFSLWEKICRYSVT